MLNILASICSEWLLLLALHLSGQSFPRVLSAAEERECFERAAAGDTRAREQLISHNLRLVAHVAKKYYALPSAQEDLISVGTIGLIKAVDSFKRSKGTRFATYACRCIDNEILMTFRAARRERNTVYMNDPLGTDAEGNSIAVLDTLCDSEDMCEQLEHRSDISRLSRCVSCLDARERRIVELRFGLLRQPPLTQQQAAQKLGISRSYVSRIEKRALQKLRRELDGEH